MYEIRREDEDSVLEDTDVVAVLEAMLGVSGQDFSELLKAVQSEPTGKITYGRGRRRRRRHLPATTQCSHFLLKKTIHPFLVGEFLEPYMLLTKAFSLTVI